MSGSVPRRERPDGWERVDMPHAPDGMTVYEVAEALGLSHGRVQQIEYRALCKLRAWYGGFKREDPASGDGPYSPPDPSASSE